MAFFDGTAKQIENIKKRLSKITDENADNNTYATTRAVVDYVKGHSGGTDDHSKLTNRDLPDQHTIGSITGLQEELDKGVKIYSGTLLPNDFVNFGDVCTQLVSRNVEFKTGDLYFNTDENMLFRILSVSFGSFANVDYERVSIEQAVIDYVAQEIAKIPQGDVDKPIHTTLNVEIEDDGFGGYRADYNDNDINNHRNAGGLVQAKYYNQAENQTYTYYYSTMESDRKPTFIRTFINADGKTEQVLASVGNDKKVTVERRVSGGGVSQEYVDSTFAPVIKNTASGEIIVVDDVSSVPHKVNIKCSSDTLTPQEIASANVKVCGKNLLDISKMRVKSNYVEEGGSGFRFFPIKVAPNVDITLSRATNDVIANGTYLMLTNHPTYAQPIYWLNGGGTAKFRTLKASENNGTAYIGLHYNWEEATALLDEVGYLQLEYGNQATEYEPYKCTSYPIGDDLSVTANSIAPNMTMYADKDGILLNASYNTDTKEYVNDNFVRLTDWELIDETIIPDGVLNTRQIEINKDLAKYKELLFVIGAGFSKLSDVPLSVKSKSSYYCWDTIKQIYTMTRNANWYIHINKMCSIDGKEAIMISTLPNYLLDSSFSTGSFENQGLADAMATLRQDFNCYSKNFESSFKILIRSNDRELYFMPKSRFVLYGKE